MIKIPESRQYNTGDHLRGHADKDAFFEEIIKEYHLREWFPLDSGIRVSYLFPLGDSHMLGGQGSDERVHMLFFRRVVVASVIETRTDSNFVQFDYFFNQGTLEEKLGEAERLREEKSKF